MPRAIVAESSSPGIVTYELTAHDEFVVTAASWKVGTNSGGTPPWWIDYRDPAGGIIAIQLVATIDSDIPTIVSLGPGNPFPAGMAKNTYQPFPFGDSEDGAVVNGALSEPITLTSYCTVNAYVSTNQLLWTGVDPIDNIDTGATVSDLHLWVEDTAGATFELPPSGPYMLAGGPTA